MALDAIRDEKAWPITAAVLLAEALAGSSPGAEFGYAPEPEFSDAAAGRARAAAAAWSTSGAG